VDSERLSFLGFVLDPIRFELQRDGVTVDIEPKVLDVVMPMSIKASDKVKKVLVHVLKWWSKLAAAWVDGYLARHLNQVSELGKVLDPTADRLLFIVGVGGIMIYGAAPLWFSLLVLVRELLVGGALVVLTALGMKRFDVSWWGKAGTLSLMVSFPAFLLADADVAVSGFMRVVAWGFGLPGLVLSYYAAITYVPLMRRNLAEGRAERRAAG